MSSASSAADVQNKQEKHEKQKVEPITLAPARTASIPANPKYVDIKENHDVQMSSFWVTGKIKFTHDAEGYKSMPVEEQQFLKGILGFFAEADEVVVDNLANNFGAEIKVPEIAKALRFQSMMEDIHSETYNRNIVALFVDTKERESVLNAAKTMPSVKRKVEWAKKYFAADRPLGERIIAQTVLEGMGFQASFAGIDWLQTQKRSLQGTYDANEEISRDEARHTEMMAMIYSKHIVNRVSEAIAKQILDSAINVEYQFIDDILPETGFVGMTRDLMKRHIRHCAALVAAQLGFKKMYMGTSCPFPFMKKRRFGTVANFFEKESMAYSVAGSSSDAKDNEFSTTSEF